MAAQTSHEPTSDQILRRLTAVEIDVAVIRSNYATRDDIASLQAAIAHTHLLIAETKQRISDTTAETRAMLAKAIADTREASAKSEAETRELLAKSEVETRELIAKSEAAWREALAKSETGWREALAQFEAGTHASLAALAKADADLRESITHTHTLIAELETRLIKWFVATAVTLAGLSGSLAFLAAKFIH